MKLKKMKLMQLLIPIPILLKQKQKDMIESDGLEQVSW